MPHTPWALVVAVLVEIAGFVLFSVTFTPATTLPSGIFTVPVTAPIAGRVTDTSTTSPSPVTAPVVVALRFVLLGCVARAVKGAAGTALNVARPSAAEVAN